ncbi:ankyrin repeat domain-containing protein [Mesorhizobium sp. 128a]
MVDVFLFAPLTSQAAAIHDAAKKGDVAAVAAALDSGIGVDESDGSGTPLYLAVRAGRLAVAKLLIERGADATPPRRQPWVLLSCRLWLNAGSI